MIVVYSKKDGKIQFVVTTGVREEVNLYKKEKYDAIFFEGISSDVLNSHWVKEGKLLEREIYPATLKGNILMGVKKGSLLEVDTSEYPIKEDVDVTLEFELPGTYKINLSKWPYFSREYIYENIT